MADADRPLRVHCSYPSRPILKIITVYERASRSVDPVPATEEVKELMSEPEDRLVQSLVTYSVEYEGRIVIAENVPARVDPETGERFSSPGTVEQIQAIVSSNRKPDRVAQTPVFQFAA